MQLVSISGIRNSGKTSLIVALSQYAGRQGKRAAIIVNENGRATHESCEEMPHVVSIQYVRGG